MMMKHNAYNLALQRLSRRDYTEQELRSFLKTKGELDSSIDEALEKLRSQGFVSDKRVAEQVVMFYQTKGDFWLRDKLKRRGVPRDVAEAMLQDNSSELDRALEVAHKKWPKIKAINAYQQTQKLAAFLANRGFSSDICWSAAQRVRDTQAE